MIIYDLSFKGRSVDSDRITIGLEHILICNYLTTMNFEQARKKRFATVIGFNSIKF